MAAARGESGAHHQFRALDDLEARIVLDLVRRGQLAAGGDAERQEALVQHGLEVGAGGVDGGRVRGRAGADDDELGVHAARLLLVVRRGEDCGRRGRQACGFQRKRGSGGKGVAARQEGGAGEGDAEARVQRGEERSSESRVEQLGGRAWSQCQWNGA